MVDKRKIFNWILNILLVILLGVGIYLFLTRILGHSPTDFQLILWIAGFSGTALLKIFNMIYNINREIGEIKIGVMEGFGKIKQDMKIINQTLEKRK